MTAQEAIVIPHVPHALLGDTAWGQGDLASHLIPEQTQDAGSCFLPEVCTSHLPSPAVLLPPSLEMERTDGLSDC